MNNYHYTIYAPTNESIDELIESHKLPTWDEVSDVESLILNYDLDEEEEAYLTEQHKIMSTVINNFVAYHIQDNAVYVDGYDQDHSVYESACLDTTTNRYAKLYVDYSKGGSLKVTDNIGKQHTVSDDCNNILTRQYFFNGSSLIGASCTQIYSSSYAVIHQIDTPMMQTANPYYNPEEYDKVMAIVRKYMDESAMANARKPKIRQR